MKTYYYLLLCLTFCLGACATGKRAYMKGDYYKSVNQAVDRLRANPKHKQSREIIKFAYPELVKYNLSQIDELKRGSNGLRWEKSVDLYNEINMVNDEIQRCPAALRLVELENVRVQWEEAKRNAAEFRYQKGLTEMQNANNRQSLKNAYANFDRALTYRGDHPDARNKLNQVREMLTIHVVMQPIPMHSIALSLSNEFFENQLMDHFRRNNRNEFIKFHSARENVDAEQFLVIKFDDFALGQTFVKETIEDRRKDSVLVGKTPEGVPVYGTVKAKMRTLRKSVNSGGQLDVKIIDAANGAILSQQKFQGSYVWEDLSATFQGDERALSSKDMELVKRRESLPPPPQQLFIEFTKPIFSQVTGFIEGYYRNF